MYLFNNWISISSSTKANATGRSAKTVHEFLEKYYTPEEVSTEKGCIKLAIRALLEVVQSGQKNLEIAVMRRGKPLQVHLQFAPATNLISHFKKSMFLKQVYNDNVYNISDVGYRHYRWIRNGNRKREGSRGGKEKAEKVMSCVLLCTLTIPLFINFSYKINILQQK